MKYLYNSARLSGVSLGTVALASFLASGLVTPAMAATLDSAAEAQPADAPADTSTETAQTDVGVGEIVVTARRVAENLQDVPQQVTAVSGNDLSELSITQFEDVAAVVPALTLGRDGYGFAAPQIRGVPFDFIASVNPTVDIYLNEVPLQPGPMAYSAFFDVESIQVLEGPQGTARGRTAPSGAILITSRRPDLEEFGGFVSGLAAKYDERNLQGAVNVPIVPGKLALRLAGLYSKSGGFVRSVNSDIDPGREEIGFRATARFKPSDDFEAQVTYQHQDTESLFFPQVFGNGSPGATFVNALGQTVPNPFAPPGYNGPVITPFDRLAVSDFVTEDSFYYDMVVGQVNANLFGHQLSYIGGYYDFVGKRKFAQDAGNVVIGAGWFQEGPIPSYQITQEVRLASERGGFFDYTMGYFFSKRRGSSFTNNLVAFLPGAFGIANAFGAPVPADPRAVNTFYMFPLFTNAPLQQKEHSVFASVTLRPGPATEITLGARKLFLNNFSGVTIGLLDAPVLASPNLPVFGGRCENVGLVTSTQYPGFCDVILPAGAPTDYINTEKEKPWVFSASVSHNFTDDIMVYGNVATSHRMGFPSVAVHNADEDPVLADLLFPRPEKSISFEIGAKTNWLENRLRVNAAVFYQKFKDLLFTTQGIPYWDVTSASPTRVEELSVAQFNANGDAVAKGFNLDVAYRPSRWFSISGQVAYARTKLKNALVPCRDVNFDGVPDPEGTPTLEDFQDRGIYVAQCRSNATVTRNPLWKATIQSEFAQPLTSNIEGYVRGLLTYYTKNPNLNANFTVDNYALLTLYAGVRSSDGAWDVGLFLRNAANEKVQLSRGEDDLAVGLSTPFGLSGYRSTSVTAPRQFGVSARYSFGSR